MLVVACGDDGALGQRQEAVDGRARDGAQVRTAGRNVEVDLDLLLASGGASTRKQRKRSR